MKAVPKISLIMASFNRAELLDVGLGSLCDKRFKYPFEVVVVNDGKDNDGTKEVCKKYKDRLDIKYVFSGHRNKKKLISRNPAIPNNIAIKQSSGDIIILSCPEILHLNRTIDYLVNVLLLHKRAIAIPDCMYFDDDGIFTKRCVDGKWNGKTAISNRLSKREDHVQMPFLLGVWKDRVLNIGGYDEDFIGYASEDNDFVNRLIKSGCVYKRTPAEIVHLYHGPRCPEGRLEHIPEWKYNRCIMETRKSVRRNVGKEWGIVDKTITGLEIAGVPTELVGIPKLMHLYWDESPMSWLQTLTVTTFHMHNPEWRIFIYVPIQKYERSAKYIPDYTGIDYFDTIKDLPYVTIVKVDLKKYKIDENIHNILRSDIFRYNILYEKGGLWSDFDIIWLRPIECLLRVSTVGDIRKMGASVCRFDLVDRHHNISVLLSKPKHLLYKFMIQQTEHIQKQGKDPDKYYHQTFGTDLLDALFLKLRDMTVLFPDVVAFPYRTFYPYSIFNMEELYKETKMKNIDEDVICVHWFNGHKLSKEYVNDDQFMNRKCSMTSILKNIVKAL